MKYAWLVVTTLLGMHLAVPVRAAPGDLYPQGDVFCFTFYSTRPADSVYSLANQATAIGPYYGDQSDDLARAEIYDTKFLYKVIPPSMDGMGHAERDDPGFVWPSDTQISNEVATIVSAMQTNQHIAQWDVVPEEMRWYKPLEMHYLDVVSEAIRANDPAGRPVYMYEQNNRRASELENSVIYQDICAKGTYVNAVDGGAFKYHRIWARWSMEQELGAIANANPSATPWIVLWMAADAGPGEFGYIDDWCRHDAYMGLIMGGKGLQIWSGFRGRAGFSDPHFDAYLDGYLSVAQDLNGPLNLAPVFLYGTLPGDANMTITSGPATLQLDYRGETHHYPPITYLNSAYNGAEYLFMVNSATQDVSATFSGLPNRDRNDLFDGGTSPTAGGSFSITLGPWEVKAFSFSSPNPALLAYEGFHYPEETALQGQPPTGQGFTTFPAHPLVDFRYTMAPEGLYYVTGDRVLQTTGRATSIDAITGGTQDVNLPLATPLVSGDLYFSFLIKVEDVTGWGLQWGLLSGAGENGNTAQTLIRSTTTGPDNFSNFQSGTFDDKTGPMAIPSNTYFVVGRVTGMGGAAGAGTVTTWWDPSDLADVANSAATTVHSTGGTFTNDITHVWLGLGGEEDAVFDEIRLGTDLASVVPTIEITATNILVQNVASIEFETSAGIPYTLEGSLGALTNWAETGMSVIGDGAAMHLYDVLGPVTSKFFRVAAPSL